MNTKIAGVIAVLLAVGVSVATGLIVHHNDQTNSNHAMMVSSVMEKDELKKAVMKQKQTDEMMEHESMNSSASTN